MTNIDELQNQLALMKQALLFYGDIENYKFYEHKDAPVAVDEGAQARFALEQLEKIKTINDEMGEEYIKSLQNKVDRDTAPENIVKLIKEIKNASHDSI